MTFLDLHISGFGRFSEYELSFAPGVNILYGHNEAGKTTLHTFLRAMLFGLDRRPGKGGKKSPYESCRPWTGGPFGGTLRIRSIWQNIPGAECSVDYLCAGKVSGNGGPSAKRSQP